MTQYEYKVVPAPSKGTKVKGVKAPEDRFALVLQDLMNELGREGWMYLRADTLPSLERSGLTGSATNWRHVLVFQRPILSESLGNELAAQVAEVKEEVSPTRITPAPNTAAEETTARERWARTEAAAPAPAEPTPSAPPVTPDSPPSFKSIKGSRADPRGSDGSDG